jgi:hypothetical protein
VSTSLASFAHAQLLVSVLVPDDWALQEVAANQVRFFAPEEPDLDDYQPTLSITMGEPDGTGPAWFDGFCEAALQRLRSAATGFELLRTERTELSSLVPMHAIWYRWASDVGLDFSQVQAYIPVDASRMYLINAATQRPLEARDLPVFDEILASIRILPPR